MIHGTGLRRPSIIDLGDTIEGGRETGLIQTTSFTSSIVKEVYEWMVVLTFTLFSLPPFYEKYDISILTLEFFTHEVKEIFTSTSTTSEQAR